VAIVLQAFLGAAECHARAGRPTEAIGLLEKLSSYQAQAFVGDLPGLVAWIRGQYRLIELYQTNGRAADSERVRDKILPLLFQY
jgi:hypothetical protein